MQKSMIVTLRAGWNGCSFTDDIFKCIFINSLRFNDATWQNKFENYTFEITATSPRGGGGQ